MTIFGVLGEDFLKITLSEREYKKLISREGMPPKSITMNLGASMNKHIKCIVKVSGNSGHVYVPRAWVGKCVMVTLIE